MQGNFVAVVTDPESFFEEMGPDPSVLAPSLVVVLVGALSAASAWVTFQHQREFVQRAVENASNGNAQLVGQMFAVFGSLSIAFTFLLALVAWLYYGGLFLGISGLLDGEGSFKSTMVVAAWGFVPKVVELVVKVVGSWYLTRAVPLPDEATQQTLQNYQQALSSHPVNVLLTLVGIAALLWSAYIWYEGIKVQGRLNHRQALIAVGVPAGIVLLTRLWALLSAV